jgi:hypothetical protein
MMANVWQAETTEQLKIHLGHLEHWIRYTFSQLDGLRSAREDVLVELEKRETQDCFAALKKKRDLVNP